MSEEENPDIFLDKEELEREKKEGEKSVSPPQTKTSSLLYLDSICNASSFVLHNSVVLLALLIEKKFLASFLFLFLNNHQFHTSGAQHNVSITSSRTTKQSSRGTFHRSSPIFHFIFNYLFFIMYFYIIILYFLLIFN